MQMQGVYYKRNDVENARTQVGVLAQDMEGIVPEVVLTADDEMLRKSVGYGKLQAVLMVPEGCSCISFLRGFSPAR